VKADIKAQWVKDLRSGEYEQGQGVLRTTASGGRSKYCCLGVLCQQAVKAGVIPEPEFRGVDYFYLNDTYDWDGKVAGESFNENTTLPRKVQEWAGLGPKGDVYIGGEVSVIQANDSLELSFAKIADLIERNVPAE